MDSRRIDDHDDGSYHQLIVIQRSDIFLVFLTVLLLHHILLVLMVRIILSVAEDADISITIMIDDKGVGVSNGRTGKSLGHRVGMG